VAGEIQVSYQALATLYYLIRNRTAQVWSTSGGTGAFEVYATANYSDYAISLTEQGTASAFYAGTFPAAVPAGVYSIQAKQQIAGSVAQTDPAVAVGDFQWNGTVTLPLSDLVTSGQFSQVAPLRFARGVMIQNFPLSFKSSADHVTPLTSGVVSGQISKDGASFVPLQSGAFTEVGNGVYSLQALTSGDLLCNTAALRFVAVGVSGGTADPVVLGLVTQRVSGSV
jgi:hypothetical protein